MTINQGYTPAQNPGLASGTAGVGFPGTVGFNNLDPNSIPQTAIQSPVSVGGSVAPTASAWTTVWDATLANGRILPSQTISTAVALTGTDVGSVEGGCTAGAVTIAAGGSLSLGGVAQALTVGATYWLVHQRISTITGWAPPTQIIAPSVLSVPVPPTVSAPTITASAVGLALAWTPGAATGTVAYNLRNGATAIASGITSGGYIPQIAPGTYQLDEVATTAYNGGTSVTATATVTLAPQTYTVGGGGGGGQVSVQSAPFTLQVVGVLAAATTFNIAMTGGIPSTASLTLQPGTNPSGQFTVTPSATPQTCVISFANSGALANPAPLNWVSTAGATVASAPTGLALGTIGQTSVPVTWTAPASNGGSAITGYRIGVRTPAGSGAYTYTATGSTATSGTATGLVAGQTFDVVVDAVNGVGNSPDSTLVTGTAAAVAAQPTFIRMAALNGISETGNATIGYTYTINGGYQSSTAGSAGVSLPIGVDGYVEGVIGSSAMAIIGLDSSGVGQIFSAMDFGVYPNGASYAQITNGAGAGAINGTARAPVGGDKIRLEVIGNTVYAKCYPSGGSAWITLHTFVPTRSVVLYPLVSGGVGGVVGPIVAQGFA